MVVVVVLAEEMAKRSPESLFFVWGEAALIRWDNVGGGGGETRGLKGLKRKISIINYQLERMRGT